MLTHRSKAITIKSKDEIAIMREAGRHVAEVMHLLVEALEPGITTGDLDKIVRREFARRGLMSPFLGYAPGSHPPYPAMVCVSVNEQLVHGIPGKRELKAGDLVSLDLGAIYRGFVGDHAVTVCLPPVSEEKRRLIEVTRDSLLRGIAAAGPGVKLGVVSHAIGSFIERQGYGVVREYGGHGVGRSMHEEPHVPNFGEPERGPVLRPGMVLALEPMVTAGDWLTKELPDRWTVATADGSLCAHFEHTIAITEHGSEILTRL